MEATRTITRTGGERSPHKRSTYLFLAFRCDQPLDPGARFRLDGIDAVELGRADALRAGQTTENGARVLRIGIPDPRISSVHARLEKVLGSWMVEDRKSKNGTLLDGTRTSKAAVTDGAILELGHTFLLFHEEPAADGPEELADGVEQVLGHARAFEDKTHEGEERNSEQRLVAHHSEDAVGQRLEEIRAEQTELDAEHDRDDVPLQQSAHGRRDRLAIALGVGRIARQIAAIHGLVRPHAVEVEVVLLAEPGVAGQRCP